MSSFLPQLAVPKPPLRDQAYAVLKDAILSGKFKPGHRLLEQEIARSLGLSRSPVREAFRRLEQEGYLSVSRSGVIVQEISRKDIEDLYFVRERLEGITASLAAERATVQDIQRLRDALPRMEDAVTQDDTPEVMRSVREFNTLFYALSGNKCLIETLDNLYEQVFRFTSLNVTHHHRGSAVVEEHRQIVEAIARHDAPEAERLAREHVQHAWEHAQKSFFPAEST